jgi:hypothetical protein
VTLQDLGALGDLIGGLGVVVTLAYLAVQVRQNSSLITAQTVQASVDATQRVLLLRVENASLRSILRKARSRQPLDADDAEVITSYLQASFMNFQARFQHNRRGVFDESANESYERILEDYLAQGYARRWWQHAKPLFGTPFRDHCDGIIAAQDAGAALPVPDWRVIVDVMEAPSRTDAPNDPQ